MLLWIYPKWRVPGTAHTTDAIGVQYLSYRKKLVSLVDRVWCHETWNTSQPWKAKLEKFGIIVVWVIAIGIVVLSVIRIGIVAVWVIARFWTKLIFILRAIVRTIVRILVRYFQCLDLWNESLHGGMNLVEHRFVLIKNHLNLSANSGVGLRDNLAPIPNDTWKIKEDRKKYFGLNSYSFTWQSLNISKSLNFWNSHNYK